MNRSQMRQRVKELMNMNPTDPAVDNGRPSNAMINSAIEESRMSIYSELESQLSRRFGTSTTTTYIGAAESVSLPSGVQQQTLFKVEFKYSTTGDYQTLDSSVIEEFRNYSNIGEPQVYAVVNETLYLRPKPPSDCIIRLWYTPVTTALGDSDSPSEISPMFHHVIARAAAVRLRRDMGDPVGGLSDQLQEDKKALLMHYETLNRDNGIHETASVWGT